MNEEVKKQIAIMNVGELQIFSYKLVNYLYQNDEDFRCEVCKSCSKIIYTVYGSYGPSFWDEKKQLCKECSEKQNGIENEKRFKNFLNKEGYLDTKGKSIMICLHSLVNCSSDLQTLQTVYKDYLRYQNGKMTITIPKNVVFTDFHKTILIIKKYFDCDFIIE